MHIEGLIAGFRNRFYLETKIPQYAGEDKPEA
jgi:hypothetical protein